MSFLFDKPLKFPLNPKDIIAIKTPDGKILNAEIGSILGQMFDLQELGKQCILYPETIITDCETGEEVVMPLQLVKVLLEHERIICEVLGNQIAVQRTYDAENIEIIPSDDGVSIFSAKTAVTGGFRFDFKKIVSDDIILTEDDDRIYLSLSIIELQDFIVDTRFASEIYEEKGTYAKPFKSLDNAILKYIGTGTRVNPQYGGARIFCTGGTNHNFTENLSIVGLVLEVDSGTIVRYTGTDKYPIDFRTIQGSLGGYGNQTKSARIQIKGKGEIISNNLLAYIVNSGSTTSSPVRHTNNLTITDLRITSLYKESEFVSGIKKSDGSDWTTSNNVATFYFGGVEEAVIVCEGQGTGGGSSIDNSLSSNLNINSGEIYSRTQQVIEINSSYVIINNSFLTNNFAGRVIADNGALSGTTLTESPLGTNTLPTFKNKLCLVEINGTGALDMNEGKLSIGFEITRSQTWYLITSSTAFLKIQNATVQTTSGGIKAQTFIDTGSNEPSIQIDSVTLPYPLEEDTVIKSTIPTYTKSTVKNSNFNSNIGSNIDLTRGNLISVVNTFKSKIKESLRIFGSRASAVSNNLMSGDIFINRKIVTAGNFVMGEEYVVLTEGTPSLGAVGSYFTAVNAGTGTGTAYSYKRDIIL